ncbi:MAG: hypothetical protein M9924_22040 [Rhizobiaceae bacterium]|nr:hypothetical protein [Rhizobiaceae bacterium]
MANYYTHFSVTLDVKTPENALAAIQLHTYSLQKETNEPYADRFRLEPFCDNTSTLWIYDEESGSADAVVDFVLLCAEMFDLNGLWGFETAETCSKPRFDAFGGTAYLIDLTRRECVDSISTNAWLANHLRNNTGDRP